jgi:hypothetical protein
VRPSAILTKILKTDFILLEIAGDITEHIESLKQRLEEQVPHYGIGFLPAAVAVF